MLKMKIIFMYCALASSFCVLAGESNTCLVVPSNQTGVLATGGGYAMYPAAGPILYATGTSTVQKKIKKPALVLSQTDFLNQEIEKLVCLRKDRTKIISDQINAQYVGVAEKWSLKRYLEISLEVNAPAVYFFSEEHNAKDAVKDLVAIHSLIGTPLDKQLIDELRFANARFDRLLRALIVKSKCNAFGNSFCRPNIKGSTIDISFDMAKVFPDLPVDLQQYIYFKLEQGYRDIFWLKECVKFVPHLLHQALLGSEGNKEELEALLQSSVLKKYSRENRKLALEFKRAIRGSFAKLSLDTSGQLVEFGIEKSSQDAIVAIQEEYRCADGTEHHLFSGLEMFAMLVLVFAFI